MTRAGRLALLSLLVLLTVAHTVQAQSSAPDELKTIAERSEFQATSTSAQVDQLLDRLADRGSHLKRTNIGTTVEGRPIGGIIVSNPAVTRAAEAHQDDRVVVMIIGNIHSGECAGKEAMLMMLRELALADNQAWLDRLVLVVIPNYNADANDRMGKNHRPGQIGPAEGMGLRANAQGLDLNRDFIKLESPEARSLVKAINDWDPHVFIDLHTTNGSRHRYALTYDVPHNPASPAAVRNFMRDKMMPAVTKSLNAKNVNTFYYGNFNRAHTRWTTYSQQPRFSTEYLGLRGRLGILSEAYSYISYRERIEASKAFAEACLDYSAENAAPIKQLVRDVDAQMIASGKQPRVDDKISLRSKLVAWPDKVTIDGYDQTSSETPKPPKDHEVDFYGKYESTLGVTRPYAYLLPFELSRVADRLRMHGLQLEQLTEDVQLEVEVYRAEKLTQAARPFQGHRTVVAEVNTRVEQRKLPAGTYVVRTAQPLGTLSAYLLEPQSDDGLVTWNFFDQHWKVGSDFPVVRLSAPADLATQAVKRIEPAQRLNLDQIYGPDNRVSFGGGLPSVQWSDEDPAKYSQREGERTYLMDAATGEREFNRSKVPVREKAFAKLAGITAARARQLASRPTATSEDGKGILVAHANDLFYYREGAESARRLTNGSARERMPAFSPDGRMVAFVRNYDLHVVDVETSDERQLTEGGSDELLHGLLDWVYQEELYGRGNFKGFWWSPDSSHLAFLKLDESPVLSYTVPDQIPFRQSLEVTNYPKSGDPLPKAQLGIVPAAGGTIRWVDHYEYSHHEFLISRVDWDANGQRVLFQVQDRPQTWLDLCAAGVNGGKATKLFREPSPAWVNVLGPPEWLKDGSFLWLSERSGNQHIYHVSKDGKTITPVTKGDWDVSRYYGIDKKEEWIYFLAYKENNRQAHGYRIHLDGSHIDRITPLAGSHSLRFNKDFTYCFDFSSGIHEPMSAYLLATDGRVVRAISPYVDDQLKYYKLNRPEFLQVPASDGTLLDAVLIRPTDFDPEKKYPVLVYTYSGPQAPVVRDNPLGNIQSRVLNVL